MSRSRQRPRASGCASSLAREIRNSDCNIAVNSFQYGKYVLSIDGDSFRRDTQRAALVPVGGLLIGPADAQGGGLVIAAADDLQRQWQPGRSEPVRQCQRAQLQRIHEAGEMRRGRGLVDLVDRD